MSETLVLQAVHEHVGLVRMNRPDAHNALSAALLRDVMDALEAFDGVGTLGAMASQVATGRFRWGRTSRSSPR